MAKQVGTDFIGCVGGLVFYKMDGQYYVRQKSSLSRKRVLKSPKFKRTMENAGVFGKASRIAAKIYRSLDKQTKDRSVYNKLTGMVNRMLKEGKVEEEIISHLSSSQETTQVPSCEPDVAIDSHTSRPLCAFAPLRANIFLAKAQRRKGENTQDLKSFLPLCETKISHYHSTVIIRLAKGVFTHLFFSPRINLQI